MLDIGKRSITKSICSPTSFIPVFGWKISMKLNATHITLNYKYASINTCKPNLYKDIDRNRHRNYSILLKLSEYNVFLFLIFSIFKLEYLFVCAYYVKATLIWQVHFLKTMRGSKLGKLSTVSNLLRIDDIVMWLPLPCDRK